MRYMAGGSLADWIIRGKFSLQDTARILERLASGLEYAHNKGIVHRDLKPENVLFDRNDNPYITDFSVAKLLAEAVISTTGHGIIGTPAYISPEQAQSGEVDSRSDIYGMGVIIYEMLTGEPAYSYHLKRDKAVFREVVSGRFKPTGRVDLRNIPQIAERAIQRNPAQRFTDVMSFAAELRPNFPAVPPERKPRRIDLINGGDELGRTQLGNNNAYCHDSPLTWTPWTLDQGADLDLLAYVQALAAWRRATPALRRPAFYNPDGRDVRRLRPDGTPMTDADWRDPAGRGLILRLFGPAPQDIVFDA